MSEPRNSWGDDFRALKRVFRKKSQVSAERPHPRSPRGALVLVGFAAFGLGVLVAYPLFKGTVIADPVPVETISPSETPLAEPEPSQTPDFPELSALFQEKVPGDWESLSLAGCAVALSSDRGETNSLVLRRTVGEAFATSGYTESISWDGESQIEGFTLSGNREEPSSEASFVLADDSMSLCVR